MCDREGDFHELFAEADRLDEKFLARLVQSRLAADGGKVLDRLKEAEPQGKMTAHVAGKPSSNTPACDAELEYRYLPVEVLRLRGR